VPADPSIATPQPRRTGPQAASNGRPLKAAAQPGNALEVAALSVQFDQTPVFAKLSFDVAHGSALAIIGPNGAGKTVLFNALIGQLPHDGSVRWAPKTRIGYVPQKLGLDRDLPLTGDDFLRAKASVTRAAPGDAARALSLVKLEATVSAKPIGTLSGGQFQRLLVAAALVGAPTVLLLDEPTAGVDEPGQETMNETVDRLRREQGLTVLLISHDLSVVYRYATNVLCLSRKTACFGAPRTILTPAMLEQLYGAPVGYHAHDGH
jgi:zinc transport system ATP-binding protein